MVGVNKATTESSKQRRVARPAVLAVFVGISLVLSAVFFISPAAFSGKDPFALGSSGIGGLAAPVTALSPAPLAPVVKRYDFRMEDNQTFSGIMSLFGLTPVEVSGLRVAAMPIYDLSVLRKDTVLKVIAVDDKWQTIEYRTGVFDILNIARDPSQDNGVKVWKSELPHETRLVKVSGVIEGTLFEAGLRAGADATAIMDLSDIFAWDIDFAVDIRRGDRFSLLYESLYVEGRPVKTGRVIGAEMSNEGRRLTAIYFDGDVLPGYYDEDGGSLSRTLLKSPLRYRRISSYFSKSRFHPILKTYRPHHGIDYSAPTGTPVEAAGNGRVTFAGWKSGYGNFIEIKHPNAYSTGYGHLSKIKYGIRIGATVEQGDVIAYVGSTGISTGPHLHYEVRRNGSLINPLGLKSKPNSAVAKADMARFASLRDEVAKQLTQPDIVAASQGERFRNLSGMVASRR